MKKTIMIPVAIVLLAVLAALGYMGYVVLSDAKKDYDIKDRDESHLYFENDQFVILQMTDFHEWLGIEKGSGLSVDIQSDLKPLLKSYIQSSIAEIKPNLVVLTGDNIFSLSSLYDGLYAVSVNTYRAFAQVFEDLQQPWTMTFGNHDSESTKNKLDFLKAAMEFSYFIGGLEDSQYCKQFVGLDDRYCNFSIPILDDNNKVRFNIFTLDSGSYNSVPAAGTPYKYITDDLVDWYKSEATRLKEINGSVVPSFIFTHIPLLEHQDAYISGEKSIGVWTGISPSDTRSKIFDAAKQMGDVKGIFVGHNHANSISAIYKNIMMAVTPATQAASYQDTSSTLYSRVITIYASGSHTTYIHSSNERVVRDEVIVW